MAAKSSHEVNHERLGPLCGHSAVTEPEHGQGSSLVKRQVLHLTFGSIQLICLQYRPGLRDVLRKDGSCSAAIAISREQLRVSVVERFDPGD